LHSIFVGYSLAFGFFKLNNYALFFNLPFFLSQHFSPQTANLISILYDVGMMPGGVIVGSFSDFYGGRRACVIATFMSASIVLLTFFAMFGESLSAPALLILLGVMGCLVGGPNNIITSAVAADLSEHPTIRGNARALGTVTGIINGSGSIIAALALLMIGPLQQTYGWSAVWFLLIGNTIVGTLLMSPQIYKELYYHDCPEPAAAAQSSAGYQAIKA
jgi:sugar phosphate permease